MKKTKYSTEIKERVASFLLESEKENSSTFAAIIAIFSKIECASETLRTWHQKHLNQRNPVKVQLLSH
jgi:transposase